MLLCLRNSTMLDQGSKRASVPPIQSDWPVFEYLSVSPAVTYQFACETTSSDAFTVQITSFSNFNRQPKDDGTSLPPKWLVVVPEISDFTQRYRRTSRSSIRSFRSEYDLGDLPNEYHSTLLPTLETMTSIAP